MKKQLFTIASVIALAGAVTFTSCKKADTTPPTITVNGNSSNFTMTQSLPATANQGTWSNPTPTANDDKDGDISSSVSVTGTVDPNTKGSYTLTYSVSDAAGNSASLTVTVNIVNDAEWLSGIYSVKDSVYNPVGGGVYPYTDTIRTDNYVNNKIWVNKFGDYQGGSVYFLISGTVPNSFINLPNSPAETVTCGSPSAARTFTNTNSTGNGGTITGSGAAGTSIFLDYKETVASPPSTDNAIELYTKQ